MDQTDRRILAILPQDDAPHGDNCNGSTAEDEIRS